MQFFKNFKIFEADEKPVEKPADPAPVKKEEGANAPAFKESFTFRNTFTYNKIAVNESFEKTMQEAIAKLDEFMKNENKDNIVEVVQINANGYASWVPTKYGSKVYSIKNNQTLANDRGTSIANEVKKRVQKYFADKGIKDINFKASEIKGTVDYKNSKEVFAKFIKDNYDAKSIITELQKHGAQTMTLVKDVTKVDKPEQYLNVNQYAEKFPDNVIKLKVEEKNGQAIYDALLKTPIYVLSTSHLGAGNNSIETAYRNSTQYAVVEIGVNDPTRDIPREEEKPAPANLKKILFEKDTDKPTADGTAAIKALVEYLQNTKIDNIQHLILIGHAEADDELGKKTFDPKNEKYLKGKDGKDTIMTEAELADLRFLLSVARCKAVYRAIANLESTKKLLEKKGLWLLPAGTYFGNKLTKPDDQRQCQVVVLTKQGEINTEPAIPYGNDFKTSAILKEINDNIRNLGFNFSKFVPKVLNATDYGSPVPNHLETAKDPTALAHWKSQFV